MDHINLSFVLQSLESDKEEIIIEITGVIINFNKKHYIISVHQGYPIKYIIINDKKYDDFIICAWCDVLIIPYINNTSTYVFNKFVKKALEPIDNYTYNSHNIKFINNIFLEIGMIPNNPQIMYNCLSGLSDMKTGMPIINTINNNKKLAGIISRFNVETNQIYCIPINYILNALIKKDNSKIFTLNEDINYISKINNYKIVCGKIYCVLHKMYISIDNFMAFNTDINTEYYITFNNGRRRICNFSYIKSNIINNNIIIKDDNIIVSLGFLNLLKILNKTDLIKQIFINDDTKLKYDKYNIIY